MTAPRRHSPLVFWKVAHLGIFIVYCVIVGALTRRLELLVAALPWLVHFADALLLTGFGFGGAKLLAEIVSFRTTSSTETKIDADLTKLAALIFKRRDIAAGFEAAP